MNRESKEILEKQLKMLSEYSKEDTTNIVAASHAMVEIAMVLANSESGRAELEAEQRQGVPLSYAQLHYIYALLEGKQPYASNTEMEELKTLIVNSFDKCR